MVTPKLTGMTSPMRSLLLPFMLIVCATALLVPSSAWATFELVDTFGEPLNATQNFERGVEAPQDVAVDSSSGDVYIAQKNEVLRFSAGGEFEGKIGYDVIQYGPDNSTDDASVLVTVKATGGSFKLAFPQEFEGKGSEGMVTTTSALPYDATAAEVQAALDAVQTIGGVGASVSVSGGYSGGTGSYEVTFNGTRAGDYLGNAGESALSPDGSGLTGTGHNISAPIVAAGGGFEDCNVAAGDVCRQGVGLQRPGALFYASAVAVDQATGDLYVIAKESPVVQVFSKEGALIGSFGDPKSNEVKPEQVNAARALTVDSSGKVYLLDNPVSETSRVMIFEPESPGDYAHYKYIGEIAKGKYSEYGEGLATDSHGDLFIRHETELYEFEAGKMSTPVHEDHLHPSQSFAVNPEGDRVYYYDEPAHKYLTIDSATGEELESFRGVKGQENAVAVAFNPNAKWQPARSAGLLYSVSQFSVESRKPAFAAIFSQPPPLVKPVVVSESVASVGSTSAALRASIDPSGYQTRYRFQYGNEDCSTHACSEAPLGGAELGSGQEKLVAGVSLSGLQPGTTYHYRVLASNEAGTQEGSDQTFTTYPNLPAGLPDGRVYELVSPAFKDGGEVFPPRAESPSAVCSECTPGENSVPSVTQSAPSGDSIAYEGFPFASTGETVGYNEYLSTRTSSGWQTQDLSPQLESPQGGEYTAFSADLGQGMLFQPSGGATLSDESPAGYSDLYAQDTSAAGSLRTLVTSGPPNVPSPGAFSVNFAGASSDFSDFVFATSDALTQEELGIAPAAQYVGSATSNLYEWSGGRLHLVNVLPGNTATDPKAVVGAGQALQTNQNGNPDYSHAVSADGSKVFWSDAVSGQVYVRENGETTHQIPDPGRFLTASADGSLLLLNDGHIYNLEAESTTDLTAGQGGFRGIAGASEDLSRVYFVDTAQLTGGQTNGYGAVAQSGADNVYAYDAAGSGSTIFVATLSAGDNESEGVLTGAWTASPSDRTAQVTADGRFLAFASKLELTGYDNKTAGGVSVFEVFEYDSESRELTCVSCGLNGTHPTGDARLGLDRPYGSHHSYPQPQSVLADGRVFFNSRTSLSPYDINGLVQDVYEYEPSGLGSCGREPGCTFLISSGIGSRDSEFVGASASGSDVFFATRDELVAADQDELEDMYDARIDGGFEELTPPACTGTGCQGVPGAPPIFATPSSTTFAGVGNFEPAPENTSVKPKSKGKAGKCPKKRTRVHGRCAKVKKAKRAGKTRVVHQPSGARRANSGHKGRRR